jgi:nucleoside-diphosphate-sugar epimerase
MMSDGNQFRPFIHVKDGSLALVSVIESDNDEIGRRFINMGDNSMYFKFSDVAYMIRKKIGYGFKIELYEDPDKR